MTVTLTQIKSALKVDYTTDDAELTRIRDAVIDFIEDYCGVSILSQRVAQYIDSFETVRLTPTPIISIASVQYYNSTNTLTTMPSTDYAMLRAKAPSIWLSFIEAPEIYQNTEIVVNMTVGYASLPRHIEQAIIAITGHWYNNPEAGAPITITTVPLSAQFILENIKVKGCLE